MKHYYGNVVQLGNAWYFLAKSSLGILAPIFQIAQRGFLLRDLRWHLFFLNEIKMVLTKKCIYIIPILWTQEDKPNSFCVRKISNRAVAGRFEMVLSDLKFFLISRFSNIETAQKTFITEKSWNIFQIAQFAQLLRNFRYFSLKDIFKIVPHWIELHLL